MVVTFSRMFQTKVCCQQKTGQKKIQNQGIWNVGGISPTSLQELGYLGSDILRGVNNPNIRKQITRISNLLLIGPRNIRQFVQSSTLTVAVWSIMYIVQSWNLNIVQSWNLNIVQSWNLNIVQSWNSNIVQSWNSNIVQSWNSNIVQSWDSNIVQSWNLNIVQSWNLKIVQSWYLNMNKLKGHRVDLENEPLYNFQHLSNCEQL